METILGLDLQDQNEYEATYKIEADVIVTAVALGFVGTRYHLNQPCKFDYEHPSPTDHEKWEHIVNNPSLFKELEDRYGKTLTKDMTENDWTFQEYMTFLHDTSDFEHVMSAMSFVLDKNDPKLGKFLKDGQSPEWKPGALITGRTGGEMLGHAERHMKLHGAAAGVAGSVTESPEAFSEQLNHVSVYQGKGAYTGMINDPVGNDTLVQRTKRVIDRDQLWSPAVRTVDKDKPWGFITVKKGGEYVNEKSLGDGGLGKLPDGVNPEVDNIRYIHGMVSAIVRSVIAGPWCIPFEHASGKITTKMASCFACTTYMYANGFPPSSTHLGRGESWVPPKPGLSSGEEIDKEMPHYYDDKITASLITRWHWDIHHYLTLGVRYLQRAKAAKLEDQAKLKQADIEKTVIDYVNPAHVEAIERLEAKLDVHSNSYNGDHGGNLFLDALTVHDSDWKRILRTLQPIYFYYSKTQAGFKSVADELTRKLAVGDILAN
jgi:hypothetical protein